MGGHDFLLLNMIHQNDPVFVNISQIAFILPIGRHTKIFLSGGHAIEVRQSFTEIENMLYDLY